MVDQLVCGYVDDYVLEGCVQFEQGYVGCSGQEGDDGRFGMVVVFVYEVDVGYDGIDQCQFGQGCDQFFGKGGKQCYDGCCKGVVDEIEYVIGNIGDIVLVWFWMCIFVGVECGCDGCQYDGDVVEVGCQQ